MHLEQTGTGSAPGSNLRVSLARSPSEIEEAQRLRYRVFAREMGARIVDSGGLDADRFDDYCEHLIVKDVARGEVVGTYRMLSPDAARAAA